MSLRRPFGLHKKECAQLAGIGLATESDIWRFLGQDREQGLAKLAQATGVPEDRLMDCLARSAAEQQASGDGFLRAHILDAVVTVLLIVVAYGGWRYNRDDKLMGRTAVIASASGLPAFTAITSQDVALCDLENARTVGSGSHQCRASVGSIARVGDVIGRITVTAIAPNTALRPEHLAPRIVGRDLFRGRAVIAVPIDALQLRPEPPLGRALKLAFVTQDDAIEYVVVVPLAFNRVGDQTSALVAVAPVDVATVVRNVARSRPLVIRS